MEWNVLLLEAGADYCCYGLLNKQERSFQQIRYITFDETMAIEELTKFFAEIKNQNCEKTIVSSAFAQALLIPTNYGYNDSLLRHIYNLPSQKQFSDKIPEWQMCISYSMPHSVFNLINDQFSPVQFFHVYTPVLKIYNGFVASNQIDIHFSKQHFRVLVKKEKQVQLAQTYQYKNPLDVVYYLLKIFCEFQMKQSETFVIVSGLIDQDSAMFAELHNYFLNLHFAQAPSYSLPANDHPHHYFTSLYNLAACAL